MLLTPSDLTLISMPFLKDYIYKKFINENIWFIVLVNPNKLSSVYLENKYMGFAFRKPVIEHNKFKAFCSLRFYGTLPKKDNVTISNMNIFQIEIENREVYADINRLDVNEIVFLVDFMPNLKEFEKKQCSALKDRIIAFISNLRIDCNEKKYLYLDCFRNSTDLLQSVKRWTK